MKKLLFAIPFLAVVLVACPDPVTPPQTIGSSGGMVSSANTVASVVFPAGALSVDTPVTITDALSPPAAPSGQVFVPGKSFTVAGGTGNFAKPAELKIKLTPSEVASLNLHNTQSRALVSQVIVLQLSGSSWITINYTFDTATNVLTVSIPGFGTYTVVVPPTPPAPTLASIALSCTPTSLAVAATSTCTATGKNSSGTALATQPAFTFNSSDTGKATISSGGLVTGVVAGSSNMTAISGGITSNAVAITVTAASSGGSVTFISTDPSARGKAISANGRIFFTTPSTQYVYDGTTSKALPALPSGYTSISYLSYAGSCIDSNGNVAYVGGKTGQINHAVYYDAAANSVSEIPFGDETFIRGCNDAKQVVATDFGGNEKNFKWQAGDISPTQLLNGIRLQGINNSGTILFTNGILKGTSFTPIVSPSSNLGSVFASGLTNAGTVYGTVGLKQLFKWNEGDATATLLGTVPGQIQDLSLTMLGVNNNGDVLLRATGFASSTDYQYWLYKKGVYTRIVIPNYFIIDLVGISDDGAILANVYNSENFGANYRVALFKP